MAEITNENGVDDLAIPSSESGSELRIALRQPEELFEVTLVDKGLRAHARGWFNPDLGEPGTLLVFFEALAREWGGWKGEKEWRAFEHPFRIAATHDGLGHISLRVRLASGFYGPDWDAAITLTIDAGALDDLAGRVKRFVTS